MNEISNRTFVSSVLFLDIVEYSKQSVTDQHAMKQRFNELLVDSLKHVAASDRIILDTGDGAAVSFQGNPEDSLFAAMHLRDTIAAIPANVVPKLEVRFGINLGPVRLIKDINGQINIIGDGINVAQRVMSFAEAGSILVSRSYFEVVSRLSDDYAKIFNAAGTRTDKHVREHAVYEIGKSVAGFGESSHGAARTSASAAPPPPQQTVGSDEENVHPVPVGRSRLIIGAVSGGIALIILTVLTIQLRGPSPQDETAETVAAADESGKTTADGAVAQKAKNKPVKAAVVGQTTVTTAAQSPAPPPARIAVVLAIKPWGEVYVDGRKKGVTPR
jgi:class 3 adenylate cyclase